MFESLFLTVVVTSGGYILAVVQFFREYKTVQKLELEIAALRAASARNEKLIRIATSDETERYGRRSRALRFDGIQAVAVGLGICLPVVWWHIDVSRRWEENLRSAHAQIETLEARDLLYAQLSAHGKISDRENAITISILKRELERIGAAPFDWESWLAFQRFLPQQDPSPTDWRPPLLPPSDEHPVANRGDTPEVPRNPSG